MAGGHLERHRAAPIPLPDWVDHAATPSRWRTPVAGPRPREGPLDRSRVRPARPPRCAPRPSRSAARRRHRRHRNHDAVPRRDAAVRPRAVRWRRQARRRRPESGRLAGETSARKGDPRGTSAEPCSGRRDRGRGIRRPPLPGHARSPARDRLPARGPSAPALRRTVPADRVPGAAAPRRPHRRPRGAACRRGAMRRTRRLPRRREPRRGRSAAGRRPLPMD